MNPYEGRGFGSGGLADLPKLQYLRRQIEVSGGWLHTYLQTHQKLLRNEPRPYTELESIQLKILSEATLLQNLIREYTKLGQQNEHSFLVTRNVVNQAQELLYTAHKVLMAPIKP